MTKSISISVWQGNYGIYPIPEALTSVRITKTGYPDGRNKKARREFISWVLEQDHIAKSNMQVLNDKTIMVLGGFHG